MSAFATAVVWLAAGAVGGTLCSSPCAGLPFGSSAGAADSGAGSANSSGSSGLRPAKCHVYNTVQDRLQAGLVLLPQLASRTCDWLRGNWWEHEADADAVNIRGHVHCLKASVQCSV